MNELEQYRKLLDKYTIQKFEKIINELKKIESNIEKYFILFFTVNSVKESILSVTKII